MDVIVVAGVSGSGKSTLIEEKYPNHVHLDIADIYRNHNVGWYQATIMIAMLARKKARNSKLPIVIEGYFLPGSTSRKLLLSELEGLEVESVYCHAPKEVCARRVKESGEDVELRLDILERVYDDADEAMKDVEVTYDF